ncbi:response regulator [Chelatococcus reniformis]|uniref:Response regulator n=1 Tax=Chelatococcus reniformis TaxID=1494448 RepID=A0A916UUM5_9HYPH|nr:response regulator [Chelatococcus reniformis]GGC88627.1 response regulator [Chelatococcus reniformis]
MAEDEPIVRAEIAATLEDLGLEVRDFSNAELAMAELGSPGRAQEVCLLVTDVHMPGGAFTGLYLARTVAERWPWIYVIVASGWVEGGEPLPMSVRFLPKPWHPGEIVAAVECARAGNS